MNVRKLLLPESELKKIEEDKNKWLAKGLETGGYLFGRLYPNGVAEVTHVIDGGPKAERAPASFSGDNEYATKIKDELRKENPKILLLGEYHLHPWDGIPRLSHIDLHQLKIAKELRPWFIVLLTTKDQFKIWDLNDSIEPVEVQVQVAKCVENREKILDRILEITKHDILIRKTALIVGLGSLGSVVAKYLGCTGLGRMILVDNEELEVVNLIRHEGCIEEIGKRKVDICKRIIENHNPYCVVETYDFDATKNVDKLNELACESDLIVSSSGSPRISNILNKISLDNKIPAIYGGIYERAVGGFVLAVKPFETACLNCVFGSELIQKPLSIDKETIARYGLNEEELHKQQGLWIDISFPALIVAKTTLTLLEERQLDYNLVLYDSNLEITKVKVERRRNCASCNEEEWAKEVLGED
jgi:molybdopterin/thiamine biosynthesis adenylyltransferase